MNDLEQQTAEQLGRLALRVADGNPDALRFCLSLSGIATTWDHVMDGDAVDSDLAHQAFLRLTLDWPLNAFLRANAASLVPVMAASIHAWQMSSIPGARLKAYDVISEVWTVVAFILGGWERVAAVMPDVRRALAVQCAANDKERI